MSLMKLINSALNYFSPYYTPSLLILQVTGFSVVLITKDFNPEKYSHLGRVLCQAYSRSGNPVSVLQSYLAVYTRGHCNGEDNGAFNLKDYAAQQAYAGGSLKCNSFLIFVSLFLLSLSLRGLFVSLLFVMLF